MALLIDILLDGTEEDILTKIIDAMPSGGKREGSGKKPVYGEQTKKIAVTIPISKEKEIKEKIKGILKDYITKGK